MCGTTSFVRRLGILVGGIFALLASILLPLIPSEATPAQSGTNAPAYGSAVPVGGTRESIIIGVTGMRVEDFNLDDSALSSELSHYAVANLLSRTLMINTCPSEGWVGLTATGDVVDKAGRDTAVGTGDICTPISVTSPSTSSSVPSVASVSGYKELVDDVELPAVNPLAGALAIGPGAALAAADSQGNVAQWIPFPESDRTPEPITVPTEETLPEQQQEVLPDGTQPTPIEEVVPAEDVTRQSPWKEVSELNSWGESIIDLAFQHEGSIIVDAGAVRAPRHSQEYEDQVKVINQRVEKILSLAHAHQGGRRIVLVSLGDSASRGSLQFLAINDPSGIRGPGLIDSSATRASGFVTIADLRSYLQGTENYFSVTSTPTLREATSKISGDLRHATVARDTTAQWYQLFNTLVLVGLISAIALMLWLPARRTSSSKARLLWKTTSKINLFAYSFIPAAFLLNWLPWWRLTSPRTWHSPLFVSLALTIAVAVLIAGVASLFRNAAAVVSFLSLGLLSLDIVLGSVHQRNGYMGSLMLTSRRFYGISNRTYLILVACGLIACLMWTRRERLERRRAAIFVALLGVAVLLVDCVPAWGADFGGPPGIIAGFGLAALLIAGIRLRWWHALVWIILTVATMGLVGLADASSGGNSHIGRFWSTLGSPESWGLIGGKIRDVTRSFTQRPQLVLAIVLIIALLIGVWYLLKRLDARSGVHLAYLRSALDIRGFVPLLMGIAVGIVVAIPINDSGAMMLKEGMYIAFPGILAVMCASLAEKSEEQAPARGRPAEVAQ